MINTEQYDYTLMGYVNKRKRGRASKREEQKRVMEIGRERWRRSVKYREK